MADNDLSTNGGEFWLYGYGSLIWKPPPHFVPAVTNAYLHYMFCSRLVSFHLIDSSPGKVIISPQKGHGTLALCPSTKTSNPILSQDHRGTPEAPGRVVTLIERSFWEQLTDHHDSAPDRVWGVAYRIKADKVAEVKDYLDIREINGYTIHYAPFYPADGSEPIRTLVYIGTPDNDQFALAGHIRKSRGPSGLNIDYLLGLEKALDELSPRAVTSTSLTSPTEFGPSSPPSKRVPPPPPSAVSNNFQHETSVKEQEETEKTD
ncbi:chaC-like protein [Colletotrichum tofieldiae]|nr:chaC-like protein [Colletotrichum tofieldiae]